MIEFNATALMLMMILNIDSQLESSHSIFCDTFDILNQEFSCVMDNDLIRDKWDSEIIFTKEAQAQMFSYIYWTSNIDDLMNTTTRSKNKLCEVSSDSSQH